MSFRMGWVLLLVTGMLALVAHRGVDAASMDVHSLVGVRALHFLSGIDAGSPLLPDALALDQLLQAEPASVEAGSDFPDFLYACNGKYADHHDEGEAAHWPPFQATALEYVRRLLDFHGGSISQWSSDTRKLVAFIFGVSVHYVTDEVRPWDVWGTVLLGGHSVWAPAGMGAGVRGVR